MALRLALVSPSQVRSGPVGASRGSIPPLGLAYLAANVDRGRYDVRVFDPGATGQSETELLGELRSWGPALVGFSTYTPTAGVVARLGAALRAAMPGIKLVAGGPHPSALPGQALEADPSLDAVVVGEGEWTFSELVDAYLAGGDNQDPALVPGAWTRRDGRSVMGPIRPATRSLDDLCQPAWDLFDLDRYSGFFHFTDRPRRATAISFSRGCAERCLFCQRILGDVCRVRTISSVVAEVRRNIECFGSKEFAVLDYSMLGKRDHAFEFCEALIRSGLGRRADWSFQCRVDHADPEIFRIARRAGCRSVSMGAESGDEMVLKRTGKGTRPEQAVQAVRWAREAGLLTDVGYIIGLPWDTHQTIGATIDQAVRVNSDMAFFSRLTPYPGTAVASMAEKGTGGLRLLDGGWDLYDRHNGGCAELATVSDQELTRLQLRAYLRFYLRPRHLPAILRVIRFPVMVRFGWTVLASLVTPLLRRLRERLGWGRKVPA